MTCVNSHTISVLDLNWKLKIAPPWRPEVITAHVQSETSSLMLGLVSLACQFKSQVWAASHLIPTQPNYHRVTEKIISSSGEIEWVISFKKTPKIWILWLTTRCKINLKFQSDFQSSSKHPMLSIYMANNVISYKKNLKETLKKPKTLILLCKFGSRVQKWPKDAKKKDKKIAI